jgi:hypothetical protein
MHIALHVCFISLKVINRNIFFAEIFCTFYAREARLNACSSESVRY